MSQPERTDNTENNSRSMNHRSVMLLVLMLLIVVLAPMAFRDRHIPVQFDQSAVESFEATDANIVFLGNSLLDTRIAPDYLGELIDLNVTSLAIDGTAPGTWYLQLANVIAEATNPPEQIYVFFHDDLLTRHLYFTGPKDQRLQESRTHSNVSGYGVLPTRSESVTDKIKNFLDKLYPIANQSSTSRDNPLSSIGLKFVGMDEIESTEASGNIFGFANKRDLAPTIQQPKYHGSFDSMVGESFLPFLYEHAAAIGSEIVFVRVAARPNDDGSPNEPNALASYSADLRDFLEARNIRYIDMTKHVVDGAVDAGMYYDGYHLKHRFRDHYTEFFAEWMLVEIDSDSRSGATP
jgi:hypothetical protein